MSTSKISAHNCFGVDTIRPYFILVQSNKQVLVSPMVDKLSVTKNVIFQFKVNTFPDQPLGSRMKVKEGSMKIARVAFLDNESK